MKRGIEVGPHPANPLRYAVRMAAAEAHVESARDTFTWRAHPARERPRRAAAGTLVVMLMGMTVAILCSLEGVSPVWSAAAGTASAGLLLIALSRFFFPSTYTLDTEGVTAKYAFSTQRLRWGDIRRFAHDANGGYLSTRALRSRLDAWRGMHLQFGEEREEAVRRIRAAMDAAGRLEGASP